MEVMAPSAVVDASDGSDPYNLKADGDRVLGIDGEAHRSGYAEVMDLGGALEERDPRYAYGGSRSKETSTA